MTERRLRGPLRQIVWFQIDETFRGLQVEKVIRSLVHPRNTYPRRKKIARELKFFRRNRHRMRYAVLKKQGLPIGSGVPPSAAILAVKLLLFIFI